MYMKKQNINLKIRVLTILMLLLSVGVGFAQNMNQSNLTNSPYTRYGFGKLGSVGNAATKAMGELGVVGYSNSYTNLYNPASLVGIDTLTCLVEAGLNGEWQFSQEKGQSASKFNAGFNYLSIHFPLWRNFAGALSLTPYSMVGYYYGAEEKEGLESPLIKNDTLIYDNYYKGTGGLQRVMMSVGWRPINTKTQTLSVGLNLGYIFGSVNHAGLISISSGQAESTAVSRSFSASGIEMGLGIQYFRRLSATKSLMFGMTYYMQSPLRINSENIAYSAGDTINVTDKFWMKSPTKLGFGVSYIVDRKLQVGAEFTFDNWSKVAGLDANLQKTDGIYQNIYKFAAGVEYQPSVFNQNYFKTCRYRAGANVKKSYIETYGSQNTEFTISAGLGMPIGLTARRRSLINLAVEYTHVQPSKSDMLKEDYVNLVFGFTFNEIMFFRNRLR